MRKLQIVARTCSIVHLLHGVERYIDAPKNEIINVCLSSLVNSINNTNHDVNLIVLDDNSKEEDKKNIVKILENCNKDSKLIEIKNGKGPINSCKIVYELVEKNATDLWYHVEDDYLHFETAIQEMVDSISYFEKLTNINVSIFPYDCICRYTSGIYPSYIFHGPKRHFRTIKHSTYTCMTNKKVYEKYKNYFELAANYVCTKSEDETINRVWNKNDVILLNPIPSLAMHIVGKDGKDPYIDVEKLWNNTPKLWK